MVVEQVVDRLIVRRAKILFGDAPSGVDRMVSEYVSHMADEIWDYDEYRADWSRGRGAGHARNELMVHDADELIALFAPGPLTPGTSNAVMHARRKGIPIFTYHEGRWTSG